MSSRIYRLKSSIRKLTRPKYIVWAVLIAMVSIPLLAITLYQASSAVRDKTQSVLALIGFRQEETITQDNIPTEITITESTGVISTDTVTPTLTPTITPTTATATPTVTPTTTVKPTSTPTPTPTWKTYASVETPLTQEDYYQGKYENSLAGANQINTIGTVSSTKTYRLVRDKIINMQSKYGYVNTPEGFAYGVCWSITTLGYAQNVANSKFKSKYGLDLYSFVERHGHSKRYSTYAKVNNSYGYAIYEDGSYILDYSFKINPNALKKYPQLRVKHSVTAVSNPVGYKNMSFKAVVQVRM